MFKLEAISNFQTMIKILLPFQKAILLFYFLIFYCQGSQLQAQCLTSANGSSDCASWLIDISTFTFNSVSNTSGGCDNVTTGYTLFNTPAFTATQGQTYNFSILSNSILTYYAAIWVDVNNNGTFETTECLFNSNTNAALSHSGTITIPLTSSVATVRMRVRTEGETVIGNGDACRNYMSILFVPLRGQGETEDYNLTISGSTSTVDMSATSLVTPTTPLCPSNQNVSVQIRNNSSSTINFATHPVTVNAAVSGQVTQNFTPVVLNTGTLAASATQNVTVASGFNMTAPGTYTFNASTSVTGDVNTGNDAMTAANVVVNAAPTASLSGSSTICSGGQTLLTFSVSGTGPYSVTYSNGSNTTTVSGFTSSPFTVSVSPTTTTTYTLIAGSNSNCAASSATGTHIVSVSGMPTATLSGNVTICPSGTAVLTVQISGGRSPFSFSYSDGTNTIPITGVSSSPFTFQVSPSVNTNYTLSSLQDQCGSGISIGNASVSISTASTALLSGNSIFCTGFSTTLPMNLTGASPWTVTYTNGTSTFTQTGIVSSPYQLTVTPGGNTTYTLTAVSNTCGTGTASGSGQVTQVSPPTAHLSGDNTVCSGNGSPLSIALTGNGPWVLSYSDGSNTTTVTATVPSYITTISASVNTTYSLVSVSAPGCGSGTTSGTANIQISSTASAALTGGGSACPGNGASLQFALTGGAPYTIVYNNGSNNSSINGITASPYILTVTPSVNTTYTIVSMNSTGCGAGSVGGSAVVTAVNGPVGILSGSGTVCQGGTGQLNITLNGTAPWAITYSDGSTTYTQTGISTSPFQPSITPVQNPTTYFITSISDAACGSGVYTGNALWQVTQPPTAMLTGGNQLCAGQSTNLTVNLSSTQNPPFTLSYTNGSSVVVVTGITSSPYIISITPTQSTTYSLLLLSNSICPAQTLNSTHAVQITALPNASFTATALQDSVTISNTSTGGSAYIWNFGDSTADVTTNPSGYVYSSSGTYTIRLVASNSCGSDTAYQTVVVQVPVRNDDDYSLSDFVLYPNPSTGVYRIQLPAILQGKKLEAEVLDIGGKVLYREFIMGDAGAYIEMPELRASGIYLVRLHHAGKMYQSKLVIR